MKNFKKVIVMLTLFFVGITIYTSPVSAEETNKTGFTKRVIHPDNQLTDGEALNLLMKPGQKQKVTVELKNFSDKETTIEVKLSGARTSGSGSLEYGPSDFKKDKSMEYDLPDLVTVPKEVKVPGNATADLILDITMPESSYEGVVTGGIELMEKGKVMESENEKGASIDNKIAFLFGVSLRMDEKKVKPDFDLRKVYPGQSNYRNAILIDLGSTQAMIARDMVLNVDISKKGKKDILYTRKKKEVSIAPNSILSFPIGLDGDMMKAGKYTADVLLKGYDREWHWTQDFEITNEQADSFNKSDVYAVQDNGINWKLILVIVFLILLLLLIIYLIVRRINKKEEENIDSGVKRIKKNKKSSK